MGKEINPFLLQGYEGGKYFCDRKAELKSLKGAISNQRNVSIISIRRIGKTALIRHLFKSSRKFTGIFIDIYRTTDQKEMIARIIEECIKQIGRPDASLLKKASKILQSVELSMSFDTITGLPQIAAGIRPGEKEALALGELFKFLEKQDKPVVIAIDEFQQIMDYPEKNTEALLREHVQGLRNVNFIFSGSNKRMLQAIFSDNRRPFYQATEPLYLGRIAVEDYERFIHSHFSAAGRELPQALTVSGVTWCRSHTYYVQYLFNRLYALGNRSYSEKLLTETQNSILKERAPEYMTMRRLMSPNQSALLSAIAKDEVVAVPTSIEFIIKHGLSAVSTVRQSLGVLLDKELIHQEEEGYQVTDVFLSRWLASDV